MADFDPPNAGDNPPPGTPSKRAEKKQDTRATPERMKAKQVEMMEIDPEDVPPSTPPRYNNSDDKDKSGKTVEKAIECDLTPEKQGKTPQSTPDRQKGKQGGKGSPSKRKPGPKTKLSIKEKEALSKWPQSGYTKETIFGEDNSLHDDEKKNQKAH